MKQEFFNSDKLHTAAGILAQGILETLAQVHGCTVAQVVEGLRSGHVKLTHQARTLAELGATTAVGLARDGKISLL